MELVKMSSKLLGSKAWLCTCENRFTGQFDADESSFFIAAHVWLRGLQFRGLGTLDAGRKRRRLHHTYQPAAVFTANTNTV